MTEHEEQDQREPELEDLDVPEEAAEEIGGGRRAGETDPIPLPYPN